MSTQGAQSRSKLDRSFLFLSLTFIAAIILVSISFLAIGRVGIERRIEPSFAHLKAQRHFQDAEYESGLKELRLAYWTGFNAEIRWFLARVPLSRMRQSADNSDWNQALAYCNEAVRIVNTYDSEGVIGLQCFNYQMFMDLEACESHCTSECEWYGGETSCVEP